VFLPSRSLARGAAQLGLRVGVAYPREPREHGQLRSKAVNRHVTILARGTDSCVASARCGHLPRPTRGRFLRHHDRQTRPVILGWNTTPPGDEAL
jgi:hypothetical protein